MNELISCLSRMLSGNELYNAMKVLPEYDPSIRNADPATRLIALSSIYGVYVPTTASAEIYSKMYLALLHSLQKKNSIDAVKQYNLNYKITQGGSIQGILGGADSFTIIGTSGIGKSSAVNRAISLISTAIIELPRMKVIPALVIQCPFDSSVKGLLFEILRKVDELLDTTYYQKAVRSRATVDLLIGSVSSVCLNHVGLLVVDEIQNVANSKNGKALVRVLTQLINNSGISIGMVGTPESKVFFEQAMQLARRSLGLEYGPMPFGDDFIKVCDTLCHYQFVKSKFEMTDTLASWLYEHCGGVVSLLVSLMHDAQEIAILSGTEHVDISCFTEAYNSRLSMLHSYINPSVVMKVSPRKKPDVATSITKIKEDINKGCADIKTLAGIAKTQNIDVVELLKEVIQVEEVLV